MYAQTDSPVLVSPTEPLNDKMLRFPAGRDQFTIPTRVKRSGYLKNLRRVLERRENEIAEALASDLGKSTFEAHTNEIGLVKHEINLALRNLRRWTRPNRPLLELFVQPGTGRIERVPFGDTLVIAPWNFPVMLALSPLVSALAAGNRVTIKPSELAKESAAIIEKIVKEAFPDDWVKVVQGGPEDTRKLIASGFDFIFFTGSSRVGSIIMKQAAETLTPVVLELGGKNPVIVAEDASIRQAARQIAWGKFNNAGQACVAPDHVYVQNSIKEEFVEELKKTITDFFRGDPGNSKDFGRIISVTHVKRLEGFIASGQVIAGGESDARERYVAPTLLDSPSPDSPVMQEEIFGPVLPIIPYDSIDDVLNTINSRPASLARYVFTGSRKTAKKVMAENRYGGGMVNGTTMQFASSGMPFGGTGASGMGASHGKAGFEAFSRPRSIISRPRGLDLPLAYPGKRIPLRFIRHLMG